MRIILAGSGLLGSSLLEPLLDSSHEVVGVLQNGRKNKGFKRFYMTYLSSGFLGLARSHDIPIIWIDRMTEEELAPLRDLGPDLLLVGGFGIIFKRAILELPRIGCVNAHSSLLPRHRGPNPFTAVLMADDSESGVTFHVMEEGIDTGDIIDQASFEVSENDTSVVVYSKACELSRNRVVEVMDRIEKKGLCGVAQDPDKATYEKNMTEQETVLEWSRSAKDLDRLVRTCLPSMRARFPYGKRTILVARAWYDETPVEAEPGTVMSCRPELRIATGEGTLTIMSAYSTGMVFWLWPAPWNAPKPGEVLH